MEPSRVSNAESKTFFRPPHWPWSNHLQAISQSIESRLTHLRLKVLSIGVSYQLSRSGTSFNYNVPNSWQNVRWFPFLFSPTSPSKFQHTPSMNARGEDKKLGHVSDLETVSDHDISFYVKEGAMDRGYALKCNLSTSVICTPSCRVLKTT